MGEAGTTYSSWGQVSLSGGRERRHLNAGSQTFRHGAALLRHPRKLHDGNQVLRGHSAVIDAAEQVQDVFRAAEFGTLLLNLTRG